MPKPKPKSKPVLNILVPVDCSEGSRAALQYASEFAQRLRARFDVLRVHSEASDSTDKVILSRRLVGKPQSLRDYLRGCSEKELRAFVAHTRGVRPRKVFVRVGSPAEEIASVARGYDLVVMGTHGRTGFSHAVLGSVAERVVRTCLRPVMTIRAGAGRHRKAQGTSRVLPAGAGRGRPRGRSRREK